MADSLDKKILALFEAIEVMKNMDQDYWLCNGTLLGIIRDNRLIPWDVDIDIGVFKNGFDKQKTILEFEKHGYSLHSDGEGSDYVTFLKYDVKVDINIFIKRDGMFVSLWRVPRRRLSSRIIEKIIRIFAISRYPFKEQVDQIVYTLEGYSCPELALSTFTEIKFSDKKVRVPQEYENILEWTYGPQWKIPNKNYDWQKEGANNASA